MITTASEDAWGSSEDLLFLGEWCKLYERRHIWTRRRSETARFHWDDREKLRRDYAYLESLHRSLLAGLAACLNEFHRVDRSVRYWQMQLDPWLASYVAVVFDRWESLRVVFEEYSELELVSRAGAAATAAPYGYSEFMEQAQSDEWNRSLHERIIESEHSAKCLIRREMSSVATNEGSGLAAVSRGRRSVLGKVASAVDGFLGSRFSEYDVVFLGSTFSLPALIRLNLALGQVPRLFLGEFWPTRLEENLPASGGGSPDRAGMRLNFQPESRFEAFLVRSIVHELPRCAVEHYPALRDRAMGLAIRTKAIVTGGRQWWDEFAKVWFAEQVRKSVKLVIAEHGGSLPESKEWFDFEADIADAKCTWCMPYHPKHTQMPPAKLVGRSTKFRSVLRPAAGRKYCSVIGLEMARRVHRAQLRPMASQWSVTFDMVLEFHAALDARIKELFRFKPYPVDQGWNLRQRCSDILGSNTVLAEKSIDRVFFSSRVIVCTYPETTFSEAMASGVPTVLMYPEHQYDLHPVALPLIESLMSAKIIFHDPIAAAAHLNAIWADPDAWWNSDSVLRARAAFRRQALDLDADWLKKWTSFLAGVMA